MFGRLASSRGFASAAGRVMRAPRRRLEQTAVMAVTENAAERIKTLLAKRTEAGEKVNVRVGIKARGCNGLSYTMNYATEKKSLDEEVSEHGVTVWIDSAALMHIIGTTMDYVSDDLSSEFVFHNPNAEGSCGCGESFTTKPLDLGVQNG
jgi:iron-sulfur cluster assembly accessory protein